jgi:hypothetical protein
VEVSAFTIDRRIVRKEIGREMNKILKAELKLALNASSPSGSISMPHWIVERVQDMTSTWYPFLKALTYALSGHDLDVAIIFSSLQLFQGNFWAILIMQPKATMNRLEKLLPIKRSDKDDFRTTSDKKYEWWVALRKRMGDGIEDGYLVPVIVTLVQTVNMA